MPKFKADYPCVIIQWNDAFSIDEQIDADAIPHKPAVQTTCGFLIRSDKSGITIAMEYGDDATIRTHAFIPAGMVKSVYHVR